MIITPSSSSSSSAAAAQSSSDNISAIHGSSSSSNNTNTPLPSSLADIAVNLPPLDLSNISRNKGVRLRLFIEPYDHHEILWNKVYKSLTQLPEKSTSSKTDENKDHTNKNKNNNSSILQEKIRKTSSQFAEVGTQRGDTTFNLRSKADFRGYHPQSSTASPSYLNDYLVSSSTGSSSISTSVDTGQSSWYKMLPSTLARFPRSTTSSVYQALPTASSQFDQSYLHKRLTSKTYIPPASSYQPTALFSASAYETWCKHTGRTKKKCSTTRKHRVAHDNVDHDNHDNDSNDDDNDNDSDSDIDKNNPDHVWYEMDEWLEPYRPKRGRFAPIRTRHTKQHKIIINQNMNTNHRNDNNDSDLNHRPKMTRRPSTVPVNGTRIRRANQQQHQHDHHNHDIHEGGHGLGNEVEETAFQRHMRIARLNWQKQGVITDKSSGMSTTSARVHVNAKRSQTPSSISNKKEEALISGSRTTRLYE